MASFAGWRSRYPSLKRQIRAVVVHTAGTPGKSIDQSAQTIRAYHVNSRGWTDIGYNAVVRFSGAKEWGRHPEAIPAGVFGFNKNTLHVCCTGNGDISDFTDEQKDSVCDLILDMLEGSSWQGVPNKQRFLKNLSVVMGHAECKLFGFVTTVGGKTCPGKKVDMRSLRLLCLSKAKQRGWGL